MAFHPRNERVQSTDENTFSRGLIKQIELLVPTEYLTDDLIPGMFVFGKDEDGYMFDETGKPKQWEINTMRHPVLIRLYELAWRYY